MSTLSEDMTVDEFGQWLIENGFRKISVRVLNVSASSEKYQLRPI